MWKSGAQWSKNNEPFFVSFVLYFFFNVFLFFSSYLYRILVLDKSVFPWGIFPLQYPTSDLHMEGHTSNQKRALTYKRLWAPGINCFGMSCWAFGCRDVCLLSNVMEQDNTFTKHQKKGSEVKPPTVRSVDLILDNQVLISGRKFCWDVLKGVFVLGHWFHYTWENRLSLTSSIICKSQLNNEDGSITLLQNLYLWWYWLYNKCRLTRSIQTQK